MSFPWFASAMLALESQNVIALRLMKLAGGGDAALDEAHLMVDEKIDAAIEALRSLHSGGTAASVIDRYRVHVAANARRLAATAR
jgi:hypothetical protein